jgi:hypothetical protein
VTIIAAAAKIIQRQSYGNSGNLQQRQRQSGTFTVPDSGDPESARTHCKLAWFIIPNLRSAFAALYLD